MCPTDRDVNASSVLSKAFAILNAFSPERPELTLGQLAELAQMPRSTTHRLAQQLIRLGGLEYEGGRYRPGLKLFELGRLTNHTRVLRETALPYMEDLYESTHEIVNLAVLRGTDILYVEKIHGHRRARPPSRVGGRLPAHATAIGKAIMAYSPPQVVGAVLEGGLPPFTIHTVRSAKVLQDQLTEVVKAGVAVDLEESAMGVQCAAAPILGSGGRAVAAVSVTGPTTRLNLARVKPLVKKSAAAISSALATNRDLESTGDRPLTELTTRSAW